MSTQFWKLKGIPRVLLAAIVILGAPAYAQVAEQQTQTVNTDSITFNDTGAFSGTVTLTRAGSEVQNDVLLDYEVNSVDQSTIRASDPVVDGGQGGPASFLVDRLIDVNVTKVTRTPDDYASIGPGDTVFLAFDVTNETNDIMDIHLNAAKLAAALGTTAGAATDADGDALTDMTIDNMCIELDTDLECTGTDTDLNGAGDQNDVTYIAEDVNAGQTIRVLVAVSTLLTSTDGDFETFALAAQLSVPDGAIINGDSNGRDAPGATGATDAVDNAAVVQNVFGDDTGSDAINFGDDSRADGAALDGQHADRETVVIAGAELSISKVSRVIYDPINGLGFPITQNSSLGAGNEYAVLDASTGQNPKAIPGAIIEYTITVSNDVNAGADADSVTLTDDVPDEVQNGNDDTISGFELDADSVGVSTGGASSTTTVDPTDLLDRVVVSACDATPVVTTVFDDFTELEGGGGPGGISLGTCEAGDSGTIVYYVTVE